MRQLSEASVRLSMPASRESVRAACPEVESRSLHSLRPRRPRAPRPARSSSPSRDAHDQLDAASGGADGLDRLPLAGGQRAPDPLRSARCSSARCIQRCCRSVASGDLGLDAAGDGLLPGDGEGGGISPLGGAGDAQQGHGLGIGQGAVLVRAGDENRTRVLSLGSRSRLTP